MPRACRWRADHGVEVAQAEHGLRPAGRPSPPVRWLPSGGTMGFFCTHLPPVEARNGQAGGLLVTREDRLEGPGSGWGPGSRGFLKSPHPGNLAGCTRGLAPTGWLYSFQRAIQAPRGQQICSSHRKWSQAHSWGSHPPPQPGKSRHLISALGYSAAPFTPWSCPLAQTRSS